MPHLNFSILAFSTNFWPIKNDPYGNSVWPQALGFQKSPNWTIFGIFYELLSTQNVNLARFARNVEWYFFCDFQTPCISMHVAFIFCKGWQHARNSHSSFSKGSVSKNASNAKCGATKSTERKIQWFWSSDHFLKTCHFLTASWQRLAV